jgi:hypothetical protein
MEFRGRCWRYYRGKLKEDRYGQPHIDAAKCAQTLLLPSALQQLAQ